MDYYDNKKHPNSSILLKNNNFNDGLNSSPRTTKLNHQKLMTKTHYEKVQEILNAQNGYTNSQYVESPASMRRQIVQQELFILNNNNDENKFQSPPLMLNNDRLYLNEQQQLKLQEPYDQPTPTLPLSITKSPIVRKSILKQTNSNYEAYNEDWSKHHTQLNSNRKPNILVINNNSSSPCKSSPLLNTQLIKQNGKSPLVTTISIPSSPLKVNVNDAKWMSLKNNNINNIINEPPSSQLSSDSGYSGQTAIQIMNNNKINSVNSSPITNESNDSYLPSYEYHQQKLNNNLFSVQVIKNPGLGFSISGGKGSAGNPFKPNDPVSLFFCIISC